MEKVPARFDKKPEFMSKQASKDSTASKKSHVSKDKDVEQSESAKLLCFNSGDNEKADYNNVMDIILYDKRQSQYFPKILKILSDYSVACNNTMGTITVNKHK